jgi:signal transduction histidine kinase
MTLARMNVAATLSIVSAAIALAVGLLSRRISRAPGSWDQRWFSLVAFSAAVYAVCNLATVVPASAPVVVWLSRLQMASVALHVWAWLRYSQAILGVRPDPRLRWAVGVLLLYVAAVFVPGVALDGSVVDRPFAPFGIVYRQPVTTAFGELLMALVAAAALVPLLRFVRAARAGVRHAPILAAAYATLFLLGVNDAFATAGADLPYLLDMGFAAPVFAGGWVIAARFVDGAKELEAFRSQLLADVEARTSELAAALDALHQAEKLAALGQFAAGVAHEVNNPASVVTANLRYLSGPVEAGTLPDDAREVVEDALEAMGQINDVVRKLVDAGRIAASPGRETSVPVSALLAKAAYDARRRGGERVAVVEGPIAAGLAVTARRDALEQVLSSLVANAVEAIPLSRPGRVELRAERLGGNVRISVRDDGDGMSPEVLRRAFDPFFTTKKPGGRGAGLGLAVARGIVEGHGGALWLESTPGLGTTALLELSEAPPSDETPDEPAEPKP